MLLDFLRLGARGAAIGNGFSHLARPRREPFQASVAVGNAAETRLKGLQEDPEACNSFIVL